MKSLLTSPCNLAQMTTHRIDASALTADVAGHQRQVTEALDVVDTANVLGDAERVVDGAPVGLAIPDRRLFNIGRA